MEGKADKLWLRSGGGGGGGGVNGSRNVTRAEARIVVIGAGAAGIATATRLLQAGFSRVVIVEAESVVGGRVRTVPFADNCIDLGAQWCHGEKDNVIYEMVKNRNLLEDNGTIYDDYKCVRSNGELVDEVLAGSLREIAENTIPDRQPELIGYEGSLGAYITEKFWREFDKLPGVESIPDKRTLGVEFLDFLKKFECSVEGSDHLFEVSGQGHLEYHLCDGELLLNWKDQGFRKFLQILMKADTSRDDDLGVLSNRVLFNRRVERIEWDRPEGSVLLRCWNGELIEADHVVCTVSLGVLQENYQRMFVPELPLAKCRAIQSLRLGTVNKFFLEFKEPFGPADWTGFAILWREQDLLELRNSEDFWLESAFGFFRVCYQPRILAGWIIGPHSRHMETLTEDRVLDALMRLLRRCLPFDVPSPVNFLRTQWYSNPNFRGTYSFRSLMSNEMRTGAWDLASPLTGKDGRPWVQFAGEATHNHFYSTVHGATETGWREAQRLIAYYDDKPSSHL